MSVTFTPNEEAQLSQTIEMFEVITQTQPLDYQSLEILKEAYSKLGRGKEAARTSKKIAEAYVQLGQLSSAILEYESILQRFPEDPDVKRALNEIEQKANNVAVPKVATEKDPAVAVAPSPALKTAATANALPVDDGRRTLHTLFVETKLVLEADFNRCWPSVNPNDEPKHPIPPLIQVLAEAQLLPLESSLKVLLDKSRLGYLPIENYDVDVDLARTFPAGTCRRWCILPFDRLSKTVLVATANPFNKQAVKEVERSVRGRLQWYVASPMELTKILRKVFR